MASDTAEDLAMYKVKYIKFPPGTGAQTPVLLQDVNGPCPLIAIANVLLLRGAISLPENVGEISQERITALVADRLLQTSLDTADKASDEEFSANIHANLSDAIALIPKLTTGVDVNVRFHDIRGFEFTNETAIFDLLNLDLVHGWLVDPQDEATATAIEQKTYNELVTLLITELGDDELVRRTSSTVRVDTMSRTSIPHTSNDATTCTSGGDGSGGFVGQQQQQQRQVIDADMLSMALEKTLRVQTSEGKESSEIDSMSQAASTPMGSDAVTSSLINKMLGEVVNDAFHTPRPRRNTTDTFPPPQQQPLIQLDEDKATTTNTTTIVEPSSTRSTAAATTAVPSLPDVPEVAELAAALDPCTTTTTTITTIAANDTSQPATPPPSCSSAVDLTAQGGSSTNLTTLPPLTTTTATTNTTTAEGDNGGASSTAVVDAAQQQQPIDTTAADTLTTPPQQQQQPETSNADKELQIRNALLCRDFLDSNPSQLTYHGLAALHEGLRNDQLAVFFRNNHFNVIYKAEDEHLYLLVTDEGYRFENDVVWEKLSGLDGDTELVGSDLKPFTPHVEGGGNGGGATGQQQGGGEGESGGGLLSGWSNIFGGSSGGQSGGGGDVGKAGGGVVEGSSGVHDVDADYALAMQLQQEEEERAARAQQREEEAQQQQAIQQQGQGPPPEYRPSGGSSSSAGTSPRPPKKDKKSDCGIM